MIASPPVVLLIAEVRKALEAGLEAGFAQKVAANALGIVQRELEAGPIASAADVERLSSAVRSGAIDDALIGELIRLTVARLEIDQPTYPPLRAMLARKDGSGDDGPA